MATAQREFDIVIVGAGVSGLYMLHSAREAGMTARVFEGGSDLGGTWFWNRYPGCRCDIESVEYSYSFSDEIQKEWSWSERYAGQPEILRYLNWVAEKLNLRTGMEFDTWIKSAAFDEKKSIWKVELHTGEVVNCKYLVTATGCLSAPKDIDIKGTDTFKGQVYYTYKWPHQPVDFTGKRVAIIGAGSSAIQSIPIIAKQAAQMTVFMRTANFSVPLQNRPMDPQYEAAYKERYPEVRAMQKDTFGGFVNVDGVPTMPRTDSALAATPEQREAEFERRWKAGGLTFYTSYADLLTNVEANQHLSNFIRRKIREKVTDPQKVEILTPREFPALTKRLCADTGYYEAMNGDNVAIVNIKDHPIQEIVPNGVKFDGKTVEFDCIVFATGFDAVTGALDRMNIQGRDGTHLKEVWKDGSSTYLGLMVTGFPNLFNVAGPGSTASLTHAIPCDEHQIDLVMACIKKVESSGAKTIEPILEYEEKWTEHVNAVANMTLFPQAASWYMGSNIPGKPRKPLLYLGGFKQYIAKIDDVLEKDFEGFAVSH